MIELFYSQTPNGRKISIMLEEIKFDYKITEIDLSKGDQFKNNFRKIINDLNNFLINKYKVDIAAE